MAEAAASAVEENLIHLIRVSSGLYRRRVFSMSVHVSIAAHEEAAKWMILYCKEHLPPDVFRKRFQHLHKYAVASAPWYIFGRLSAFYGVSRALNHAELGVDDKLKQAVVNSLSELAAKKDPASVAEAILAVLEPQENVPAETRAAWLAERERDRVGSIYVDVDDKLQVTSSPSQIDRAKAKEYLTNASVALAVIKFISRPELKLPEFLAVLPREQRLRVEREAQDMIDRLVAQEAVEREGSL